MLLPGGKYTDACAKSDQGDNNSERMQGRSIYHDADYMINQKCSIPLRWY